MQGATVARKMRILALPLTGKTATRDALTYHHFITRAPSEEAQNSLLGKAKAKAAGTWAGFGKADGGWKVSSRSVARMPSSPYLLFAPTRVITYFFGVSYRTYADQSAYFPAQSVYVRGEAHRPR
jgi:hypothetical protein